MTLHRAAHYHGFTSQHATLYQYKNVKNNALMMRKKFSRTDEITYHW